LELTALAVSRLLLQIIPPIGFIYTLFVCGEWSMFYIIVCVMAMGTVNALVMMFSICNEH